jgi:hypothetical protein
MPRGGGSIRISSSTIAWILRKKKHLCQVLKNIQGAVAILNCTNSICLTGFAFGASAAIRFEAGDQLRSGRDRLIPASTGELY